jgi:O-antigen ligase
MSLWALDRTARPRVPEGIAWWVLLAAVLTLYLGVHWIAALAVLALAVAQRARPLDVLQAYLMVVGGATFINYTRGGLTHELSLLSLGILFMLFCYVMAFRSEMFVIRRAAVTVPLLCYLGLSFLNFLRGLAVGNSTRYAGLEILAALALGSCLLVANLRFDRVRLATMAAVLLFNIALRARRSRTRWALMLALLPLLTHQFLSFTRGYWLGLIGSALFSIAVHGGRGPGSRGRWLLSVRLLAGLAGLVVAGGVLLSVVFNLRNLADSALTRLSSSTGTELTFDTSSNIVRLVEYARVLEDIVLAPWLGHGLGYSFVLREPLQQQLHEQWYVHQNYLLVWLKQGLLGLALFVTMLVAAVRTGLDGRRLEEPLAAAWCTGAAAATVFVMIDSFVHFPLAEVNATFPIALLWGGAIALTARGRWRFRWRPPAGAGGAD